MDVIVIGGGAAGMVAAGRAAMLGNNVILLEKNEKLGKKIYITGKGRCNVTNSDVESFGSAVVKNYKFLMSAFTKFNSFDTIELLRKYGTQTKIERGNRVFPVSDKASDVTKALTKFLKGNNVDIRLGTKVTSVTASDGKVKGVKAVIDDSETVINADKVIIATGGASYKSTGSTGDGYMFAESLGHSIVDIKPSLVGMELMDYDAELAGVSLKNIQLNIVNAENKNIYSDFGELIFTHKGISGPIVLTATAKLNKYRIGGGKAVIDLKPKIDYQQLDKRIIDDFMRYKNKAIKNALDDLLIKALQPIIIKRCGINPDTPVNSINKLQRKRLIDVIKNFSFVIKKTEDIDYAIITSGGVDCKEINPKTMQSKLINGLYFAGEVIDADALTGGYNLQIAFSTGYLAGELL